MHLLEFTNQQFEFDLNQKPLKPACSPSYPFKVFAKSEAWKAKGGTSEYLNYERFLVSLTSYQFCYKLKSKSNIFNGQDTLTLGILGTLDNLGIPIKGFNFDNGPPSLPNFYDNGCTLISPVGGIFRKSAG